MENIKFNKKKVFFFNCTGIWLFECLKNMQKWFYSLIFFKLKAIRKIKTILLKYGDIGRGAEIINLLT
jgi:hypothetical protein